MAGQSSPHILLVDDDALIRGWSAELLDEAGYTISEAGSGAQALEILDGDRSIVLLITDNRMPGMSGASLIGHVRARAPALPILLVSGHFDPGDEIGPDVALLGKPFRAAGLLAAVNRLIPAEMRA